jgi:hypothetical protein
MRAVSAADHAIRASTAIAVLGVAGIAAYVSYWHAYEVVHAHGESGVTARLEPATIDGLVYSSSMVVLYAARHHLPVPGLARWLLALGIMATLAANVAHGWSHGPVGAAVAAWPAASLVGSYELLLWLIRTAASGASLEPVVDVSGDQANRLATDLQLEANSSQQAKQSRDREPVSGSAGFSVCALAGLGRTSGPDRANVDHLNCQLDGQEGVDRSECLADSAADAGDASVDRAAVEAYRASIHRGRPLSERKLAAMFGKTSRRWARQRMAEARRPSGSPPAEP